MIEEPQAVVLGRDLPEHGLVAGDFGTVVHRVSDFQVFLVEFECGETGTYTVRELSVGELRPL